MGSSSGRHLTWEPIVRAIRGTLIRRPRVVYAAF